MANKASIVTKNQNQLVPDTVLDKVMEGHTAIGTAFFADATLTVLKQPAAFDKDTFKSYQDEAKSSAVISIFQTMQTPIDEGHVQPFVDEEDDGTTHLAVFVEGDLSKYALPKQPQTAEIQWYQKAFQPFVKAYIEKDKEPSIKGLMDYLSTMRSNVEATLGERGCCKVFGETGEILTFTKGAAPFKADWGEVSSGYAEGEFPAKETAKRVTSLFAKAKPKAEAEKPAPAPEPEKKEGEKTVIHQPDPPQKTETATIRSGDPDPGEGKVWARPVAMIRNNEKAMKKALNHMIGGNPKGYKYMEWFAVDKVKLPAKNWEMKGETAFSAALDKAKNDKGSDNVTPEQMRQGLMPAKMQQDLKDKFLPSVAKYTETPNLPTLEELQADENKHPTWFDRSGVHVQDTLGWPPEKVAELDRDYHAAFVLRQKAIVSLLVKMIHEHPPAKKTETEQETVPEKTGTTEDQKRENLKNINKELTTPKSLFSRFKKSA